MRKKITNKQLEENAMDIAKDKKYGKENYLIDQALSKYPLNQDIGLVAMKICLIDLTNGTNLAKNLGKDGGIYTLSEKIVQSNFDERVKIGDLTLVNELAKWTKETFHKNLFSFISKYCLYHNLHCYNRDDYAIFDSVLAKSISKYINPEDFEKITGMKLKKRTISKLKEKYDYITYMKVIDHIIIENKITVDKPHRKLDWFIWYKNK